MFNFIQFLSCMFLFYTEQISDNTLVITGDEHLHCSTVLRKKPADIISVTDGNGYIYTSQITVIAKSKTECRILDSTYQNPIIPEISIAISPTKNISRLEWFLEKSTEIGISSIYLVMTKRTERKTVNLQRLEKILISAMKQSLQTHIPKIKIVSFKELLKSVQNQYDQKYIAHCDKPEMSLKTLYNSDSSAILLIGPEGDFTKDEVNSALEHGYQEVSLGNMRLRTETAGLAGLFYMRYPKI